MDHAHRRDRVVPDRARSAEPPLHPVALPEHDVRIQDVLPDVVRQVPIGVGVLRRDRSIAYHNDELARILLLPADAGPGVVAFGPLCRRDGTAYPRAADPLDVLLRDRRPVVREMVGVRRGDGSTVDASVTITPIVDEASAPVGAVVYVEDLSRERDDLSLREVFVGVLSHELRTPITSIYGGTQLLLTDRMSPDVRASVLQDIAAEAEQLHRLVEDLMAIARIERGLVSAGTEPILLQRLAVEAARSEERRWPGHRVIVEAPVGLPAVAADDGYVTQVLRNLISNAAKYSPVEEPVTVRLGVDVGVVTVRVLDRGPGFPAETGADAFRLFYRNPDVGARVPGTGIGLYVARALVEAQGGRIWLRNRDGGGAEVGFALPLYDPID